MLIVHIQHLTWKNLAGSIEPPEPPPWIRPCYLPDMAGWSTTWSHSVMDLSSCSPAAVVMIVSHGDVSFRSGGKCHIPQYDLSTVTGYWLSISTKNSDYHTNSCKYNDGNYFVRSTHYGLSFLSPSLFLHQHLHYYALLSLLWFVSSSSRSLFVFYSFLSLLLTFSSSLFLLPSAS